jgi:hypothetical protein
MYKRIHALTLCGLLLALSACGSSDGQTATQISVPPLVAEIDQMLAKPYSDHFADVQGDYLAAERINGAVEQLAHEGTNARYMQRIVALSWSLTKRQNEDDYQSIVREWKAVRPWVFKERG